MFREPMQRALYFSFVAAPLFTSGRKGSSICREVMTLSGNTEVPDIRRSKRRRLTSRQRTSTSEEAVPLSSDSSREQDSDFDPTSLEAVESCEDEASLSNDRQLITPKRPRARRRSKAIACAPLKASFASTEFSDTRREFTNNEVLAMRTKLLDWYADNHREFPWRAKPRYRKNGVPPDPIQQVTSQASPGAPYAVWISEVMSQQTRIQVVVEYFNRWISEFPTVQHLANAPLDRVNELWAGLGYYRRARFLHEGAKQVVNEFGGALPSSAASLRKLKGIGKYTAGAVSSIAFGEDEPAVDGNVERVFSRLLPTLSGGKNASQTLSESCWKLATVCVEDIECAGDFNQALMELGATVCKPKAVQCSACPLQSMCGAYAEAVNIGHETPSAYVTRYPLKSSKKVTKVREETLTVLVVCADPEGERKFLLMQRPGDGLLAGLWEFPNKISDASNQADERDTLSFLLKKSLKFLRSGLSNPNIALAAKRCQDVKTITHIFSHIRQSLNVKLVTIPTEEMEEGILDHGRTNSDIAYRWLSETEFSKSAVSTQMKKVFKAAVIQLPQGK